MDHDLEQDAHHVDRDEAVGDLGDVAAAVAKREHAEGDVAHRPDQQVHHLHDREGHREGDVVALAEEVDAVAHERDQDEPHQDEDDARRDEAVDGVELEQQGDLPGLG